jgi:hypothetical protein
MPETSRPSSFTVYKNTSEGVRFLYPSDWRVDKAASSEYPATVRFRLWPRDGDLRVMFESGDTAALRNSPATLQEWRDQHLETLSNVPGTDFKLVTSKPATLSGYPAWRIDYTRVEDNDTLMGEIILMMNGTRYATVSLVSMDDPYNIYSGSPQYFVSSIEITH